MLGEWYLPPGKCQAISTITEGIISISHPAPLSSQTRIPQTSSPLVDKSQATQAALLQIRRSEATPTSSYLPCKPLPPSSTSWVSGCARLSKAGPKKTEGDRCHLSELDGSASTCGPFRGYPPPILRRQSPRSHRAFLAWRQEPPWDQGRRSRLQALGKINSLRHLLTRSEGVELLFHFLEGDQRFHRGSSRPVVAGESRTLSPDTQVIA